MHVALNLNKFWQYTNALLKLQNKRLYICRTGMPMLPSISFLVYKFGSRKVQLKDSFKRSQRLNKNNIWEIWVPSLTTESNGPCLNLSWNENAKGFGFSPGPLINPLDQVIAKIQIRYHLQANTKILSIKLWKKHKEGTPFEI